MSETKIKGPKIKGLQPFYILEQIVDFATHRSCACKACALARRHHNATQTKKIAILQKQLSLQVKDPIIKQILKDDIKRDQEKLSEEK